MALLKVIFPLLKHIVLLQNLASMCCLLMIVVVVAVTITFIASYRLILIF